MEAAPNVGQLFSLGLIGSCQIESKKHVTEYRSNVVINNTPTEQPVPQERYYNLLANNSSKNNGSGVPKTTEKSNNFLKTIGVFNGSTNLENNCQTIVTSNNNLNKLLMPYEDNNNKQSNDNKDVSKKIPKYKLELSIKNETGEFVKIQNIYLDSYDVLLKMQEVVSANDEKDISNCNMKTFPTTTTIEPSLTMNIEKGTITIVPDSRYTVSSGIALSKNDNRRDGVLKKDFSQVLMLVPNTKNYQTTSSTCTDTYNDPIKFNNKSSTNSLMKNFYESGNLLSNNISLEENVNTKQNSMPTKKNTRITDKRKRISTTVNIPWNNVKRKNNIKTTSTTIPGNVLTFDTGNLYIHSDFYSYRNRECNTRNDITFRPIPEQFLRNSNNQ
uniref:Serine/threonine-protein kinase n=1 Tax=Parastrongyloides trichosuri TaxID=131310 RepID=A0A0N5A3K9_PARTI